MHEMQEFYERRYREAIKRARAVLDEMEADMGKACPMCGHIPYVITATQHCWCDPADSPQCRGESDA